MPYTAPLYDTLVVVCHKALVAVILGSFAKRAEISDFLSSITRPSTCRSILLAYPQFQDLFDPIPHSPTVPRCFPFISEFLHSYSPLSQHFPKFLSFLHLHRPVSETKVNLFALASFLCCFPCGDLVFTQNGLCSQQWVRAHWSVFQNPAAWIRCSFAMSFLPCQRYDIMWTDCYKTINGFIEGVGFELCDWCLTSAAFITDTAANALWKTQDFDRLPMNVLRLPHFSSGEFWSTSRLRHAIRIIICLS